MYQGGAREGCAEDEVHGKNFDMKKSQVVHVLTVIDGVTEELVDLIELKSFSLVDYREQFDVDESRDPEMLERYSVGPDDLSFLERNIGRALVVDFSRYAYFVEPATK